MKKTRAELQEKGQFWTPPWVAEPMVRYALGNGSNHIFDPAHGMGAFFVAGKKVGKELKRKISFHGSDIDSELVKEILKDKLLTEKEVTNLIVKDFTKLGLAKKYKSIVVNPPYLRHHRISQEDKNYLRSIAIKHLKVELDGRAGLHVYFLILSLLSLENNGRLSFIVSSDVCEGIFSSDLWKWIASNYQIDAVLTFSGDATPFPNVDTNPVVFFIRNSSPKKTLSWAKCIAEDQGEIERWIQSDFENKDTDPSIIITHTRSLDEAIRTGLTRFPQTDNHKYTLGDFAYAMRGIATGNNKFFLLTKEVIEEYGIPENYLIPAIGRTRDVSGDVIDKKVLSELSKKGRPYHLLYIGNENINELHKSVKKYILYGEKLGVHKTALISTRKPWFKMERRDPPPVLFSYLGRRNSRFIFNKAGVLPLNGFLCIYPKNKDKANTQKLIKLINHPEILKNLFLVGKSYGSDAVKVEPRAIERLAIPERLVDELGLSVDKPDYTLF